MTSLSCPYCGHDSPRQGCTGELHDKLRQVDNSISQLFTHRSGLLQEHNEIHSSIGILPPEILSHIFQYLRSPPEFGDLHSEQGKDNVAPVESPSWEMNTVLSKVSINWRRIVMTTPKLWTFVQLHIHSVETEDNLVWLIRFFEYSGHFPLTLFIDLPHRGFPSDSLIHPSVDDFLIKNFWRINRVYLRHPHEGWLSHLPQLGQMTHLFLVNLKTFNEASLSLSRATSLSELTLLACDAEISSPHLTILNLEQVTFKTLFRTILNCPNLIKLYFRNADAHQFLRSPIPEKTFTLQHLEVLDLELYGKYCDGHWEAVLLNHIHTPSLRTLRFVVPTDRLFYVLDKSQVAASRFFATLPTTLTSLEFLATEKNPHWHENAKILPLLINNSLRDDCLIESLIFVSCGFRFMADILQSLTCSHRFPRLRRITMDNLSWLESGYTRGDLELMRPQQMAFLSHTFLEVVKLRLDVSERQLTLYMVHNVADDVAWLDGIWSELVELKRRGCRLDIFVESKPKL
ncbi:hypothetical protein Agabi119p4_46 [Agaricus bisporus var. burnettii]|uniref:F-box domain-containing protein n=1 Tax=Agaricus bisporus var. burnettii TaxID=192524 RepID=A0A8H7KKK2_AGABI|nr:hypothetical protein Agabi119p4_46 [Agaricus bisporus var. burnettii]